MRLFWWFNRIMCTVHIALLVLIPCFGYIGYISRSIISLVLASCLCIVHTFPGSSNNVNSMDSGFLQHWDSFLDSIYLFLAVTDILHTFIFTNPLFLQHTPVRSCKDTMFLIIYFLFSFFWVFSSDIIH